MLRPSSFMDVFVFPFFFTSTKIHRAVTGFRRLVLYIRVYIRYIRNLAFETIRWSTTSEKKTSRRIRFHYLMNIGWLVTLLARTTSDVSKRKKKKKKNRRKEAQKWSYPLKRKMIPAAHGTSVISPAPAPAPAPCSYLDIIHNCGIRKLSEKEKNNQKARA